MGAGLSCRPAGTVFLELLKTDLCANFVFPEQLGGPGQCWGMQCLRHGPAPGGPCSLPQRPPLRSSGGAGSSWWQDSQSGLPGLISAESLQISAFVVELFLSRLVSKPFSSKMRSSWKSVAYVVVKGPSLSTGVKRQRKSRLSGLVHKNWN